MIKSLPIVFSVVCGSRTCLIWIESLLIFESFVVEYFGISSRFLKNYIHQQVFRRGHSKSFKNLKCINTTSQMDQSAFANNKILNDYDFLNQPRPDPNKIKYNFTIFHTIEHIKADLCDAICFSVKTPVDNHLTYVYNPSPQSLFRPHEFYIVHLSQTV